MIETIFEHITFLLPRHKCITIPGLGAFILNETGIDSFCSEGLYLPKHTVTFNSDLIHDDGVLTTCHQSISSLSYQEAQIEILSFVKSLKQELHTHKEFNCGSLGTMFLNNGNLIFRSKGDFLIPQYYGLNPVRLNELVDIERNTTKVYKRKSITKSIMTLAASAAVVMLFLLPSTRITDSHSKNDYQQAGFLHSLTVNSTSKAKEQINTVSPKIETERIISSTRSVNITSNRSITTNRVYYIIVGGDDSLSSVERMLKDVQADGFEDAKILSSGGIHRVYTTMFHDKDEANEYLEQLRRNNPRYKTAWFLTKRNQ